MKIKYPLATSTWDQAELSAIQSVIKSDMYTMGKYVRDYEVRFAEFFRSKHCVMVNSGSSANLLMIAALFFKETGSLKRGDEVIVPAVSWSTTYAPLQQYGLKVKFVDIDRKTLNFDLEKLEKAVSTSTKAILAVNLLGNPNEFKRIREIVAGRNIYILEDNCESMGAEYSGEMAGSFGIMGSFSSFFSHHIATMEGGCVVTDDDELHHVLLCLRAHGWTRNLPDENYLTGQKSNDPFEESFKFVLPGYNLRPIEMSGAIGIEQLRKLPQFLEVRRRNYEYFYDAFALDERFDLQEQVGLSSWFGFSVTVKPEADINRARVVSALTSHGVEVRPVVGGNFLKNERLLGYFDYEVCGNLDNAERVDQHAFFVGNHQIDLREQIIYMKNLLDGVR